MSFSIAHGTKATHTRAARQNRRSLGRRLRAEQLEQRYFLFAAPALEVPSLPMMDSSLASPIEVARSDAFSTATSADPNTELAWEKNQDFLNFGGKITDSPAWQVSGADSSLGLTAEGEFSGDVHGSSAIITPAVPPASIDSPSSSQGQSVVLNPESSRFDWLLGSATMGLRAEGESNWAATHSEQTKAITETHVQAANSSALPAASSLPWIGQAVDSAIQILSVQHSLGGASISEGNQPMLPWESQAGSASAVNRTGELDWDGWLRSQSNASESQAKLHGNGDFVGTESGTLEHRRWKARLETGQVSLQRISANIQNSSRGLMVKHAVDGERLATPTQGDPHGSVKDSSPKCDAGQIELGQQESTLSPTGQGRRGQTSGAASIFAASSVASMYREFDLAGVESGIDSFKFESQVVAAESGSVNALRAPAEQAQLELPDDSSSESLAAEEAVLSSHSTWLPLGLLTLGGLMLTSRRKHLRAGKSGDQSELVP